MTQPQPPSPFLPGTQVRFAWDSTCLSALKTCPRLYYYLYLEGWSHPGESIHLRFGQEYHQALQDYDKERAVGIKHDDAVHDVVRELLLRIDDWDPDTETKAGKYKNPISLVQSVINYLDDHHDDPAQTYIMKDDKPAVELSFRFELDWGPKSVIHDEEGRQYALQPYLLCGHLDKVVTFADNLFVMDHKTTTSTPGPYWFDQWSPSNQMTLYSIAGQVVLDSPVKGVIINAAQLLLEPPYTKFVRGFTFRTPDQLDEWQQDLHHWLTLAEGYATEGYWPMNDTACDKFGGCRFREVCSKSPQVREQFLASDFTKLDEQARWNPLKPR